MLQLKSAAMGGRILIPAVRDDRKKLQADMHVRHLMFAIMDDRKNKPG